MIDKKRENFMFYGIKSIAFEKFMAEFFRKLGYSVNEEQSFGSGYADIVLFSNDIIDYVCEIKYFSNIEVSPYMLKKAIYQLESYTINSSKKMLIINSICDNNTKKKVLDETGILIFDLRNILYFVDIETNLYRDLLRWNPCTPKPFSP